MSRNPNNCETCKYKRMTSSTGETGHCYMFRVAPTEICMQHTGRTHDYFDVLAADIMHMLKVSK